MKVEIKTIEEYNNKKHWISDSHNYIFTPESDKDYQKLSKFIDEVRKQKRLDD